jgi:hypothetical protein
MEHRDILAPQNSYSNYFKNVSGITLQGMSIKSFPNTTPQQRQALQSDHNYMINKNYEVFLNTPITISGTSADLFFRDVAITEPGIDHVIAEATKNGLDWIALAPPHDASSDSQWQAAYSGSLPGTQAMFVNHELDIHDTFQAGDLLLFRFRMTSGPLVTSWGWAMDYVSIQEPPVSVERSYSTETLSAYPNPSPGRFTIDYTLNKKTEVSLSILDIYGRSVQSKKIGSRNAGVNSEIIDMAGTSAGTYLVVVHTNEGKKTRKISVIE